MHSKITFGQGLLRAVFHKDVLHGLRRGPPIWQIDEDGPGREDPVSLFYMFVRTTEYASDAVDKDAISGNQNDQFDRLLP
jgi:hypothetical protein